MYKINDNNTINNNENNSNNIMQTKTKHPPLKKRSKTRNQREKIVGYE